VVIVICLALYLSPRTAVLQGDTLHRLPRWRGGHHARIGDPLLTHILFPVYVGRLALGRAGHARGGCAALLFSK
jgi:hypothetical protein